LKVGSSYQWQLRALNLEMKRLGFGKRESSLNLLFKYREVAEKEKENIFLIFRKYIK
jgi:hypothetical protein